MKTWKNRVLDELIDSVWKTVEKHGFRVIKLSTPSNPANRSIDMYLWRNDGKSLHLKIAVDINDIDYFEQKDLFGVGSVLKSKPLAISEYEDRIELEDEVIYEKNRLPVVNVNTLDSLLSCSKNLFIVGKKKDFFVRINGEKLKKARIERDISLGQLADMLKVSRKSVYEYERGSYNVSIDVAEKLIDVLSDEILKPFNIYEEEIFIDTNLKNKPDNLIEEKVLNILDEVTDIHYHVKKAFVDIIAKRDEKKLFVVVEHSKSSATLQEKIEDIERFSFMKDIVRIAVTNEKKTDYTSTTIITNTEKLKKLLDDFFSDK